MDLVLKFLKSNIKLTRNDKIVIGVSAGPDSMCLLYLLMELKKQIGFQIVVAHINHKKRQESDEEEEFLFSYCKNNDLTFESMSINVYEKTNFHAYARKIRYRFYEDLINKYQASYLMTAHHGDDLCETVLMRLVRGSTLKGYHGLSLITKMDNYLLVRPLLYVTKEEIERFNLANNVSYRIDKSNFSDKYTRNRYRKHILPFLKEENQNVHLKFLKFSQDLEECNNYIEKSVNIAYNNVYKDSSLDILLFLEYDIFIQKLVLQKVLSNFYEDLSNVNNKHILLILEQIKKRKTGNVLNLPNSVGCIMEYDKMKFFKDKNNDFEYELELVDGLLLPNGMKFLEYNGKSNGNDIIRLSSSEVQLPLIVRNKRNGDVIELKGTNGKKKVSDIFIDLKINKLERASYPVVVDSRGIIVWVPKLKKSKYDSQNDKMCDIIFKCL